jgi:ubiquinone/menaquinone biosynthesis C-methylase UbiE
MNQEPQSSKTYLIDSDAEMLRLDRQAAIYGTADDLAHLSLQPTDRVLDAGCGSGQITRTVAAAVPNGRVTGIDREPRFIDYARRRASADGTTNISFVEGNLLSLPFENASFDVVWSKHVLQWMAQPAAALKELARVTRPGGRVVVANFDGFLLQHFPEDPQVQANTQKWFDAARAEMGFDNWMGRKLPRMFLDAGLTDVRFDTIPDKAFSGLGGDAERNWNMEVQWNAAHAFSVRVFGSEQAAREAQRSFLERFADPTVFFHCTLFYVEGRVPG